METKFYNLSNPQKAIWLTEEYYKNTSINNVGGTLTMEEVINKDLLEKAISLFISSNGSLRFKLDLSQKEPLQYIAPITHYDIKYIEINDENELKDISDAFLKEPFETSQSFLFGFIMFNFKNKKKGGFIAKLHHLISDAWSMSILIDEIMSIYSNLLSNNTIDINPPSYLTYIESENDYLNSEKYNRDKEFWENIFNSAPELTTLSKKYNNSIETSSEAKRKVYTLNENNTNVIKDFCKNNKTSPYTLFMAILGLYTGKLNNTDTVILGTPVLNRTNFKEKHTMGMFISTIPFKIDIDFKDTFKEFLLNLNKEQLGLFRHQKYPYNDLLDSIRSKYDISNNLYTTVLSYQNAKNNRRNSNIQYKTVWNFNGNIAEELELHISDLDDNNTFNFIFDYNINKFTEDDITNIYNRLFYIFNQIEKNPNISLEDIEIITPEEKTNILSEFNNTYKDYPKDKDIVEIFYENVLKYPNHTALVYEDEKITYQDLYKKISAIEKELIKNDVHFQDIIAVYMPKSIEYVAAILAILKLGAIYLPVSFNYPEERIKYMFENSKTKLIICALLFSLTNIISEINCAVLQKLR